MLDHFWDLLAWFIPREAACEAATPRVPNPPRLLAFPDAEEGDCDELGEDGISANGFPEDDKPDKWIIELRPEMNSYSDLSSSNKIAV